VKPSWTGVFDCEAHAENNHRGFETFIESADGNREC